MTVAVVSLPFKFEGVRRTARAEEALKNLSAQTDTVIKIRNDKILEVVDKKIPMIKVFVCIDEIMCRAVKSLINLFRGASLESLSVIDFFH